MIDNLDLLIIVSYLAVITIIGISVSLKTETGEDLFLGGRSLTWPFVGLSLFASNVSSSTIVGLAGAAYVSGAVHSVWEFAIAIPFAVLAMVFVPIYLRARITTIPEFLELRFDRRSRVFFSIVSIFTSIVVDTAGGLYAGAIVLQVFFPVLGLPETCFAMAIFAGAYTAFGGLKAVVYTDTLQAVIFIVGCSAVAYLMFAELGFSWSRLLAETPPDHLTVVRPMSDPDIPWAGLILGVPFLQFWYVATNQYMTQRVLGAKSIQHARWGISLASLLKLTPFFLMILPGAMAISLFPGIEKGDMVFPTIVREILPVGIVGLVLAGLISGIMSSVDSTLNSASALIVVDFIKARKPSITEHAMARYGRRCTLTLMLFAALWAPQIANFGGLWVYLQQMFAIIVPPVAIIFLLGVFYRRGNGHGAFWTLIAGTLLGILMMGLRVSGWWSLHYLITVGLALAFSAAVFIGVSLATAPPSPEVLKRYTFSADLVQLENQGLRWYQNYLYHTAVLIGLVALMYLWLG